MKPRAARAVVEWGHDLVDRPRLLLAVKAAIASAIAWYLAPFVPFADDEFSYYAPLGVLVSMYPTIARSARSGVLTIVGIGIGVLLGVGGLFLVSLDVPGIVAVAAVVGVGTALGGIRALGAGREWAAMAGLFTLLLSGGSVEEFSTSYLVTMAFGVVVGVAVNLLVLPPLYLRRASARLGSLRLAAATHLRALADGAVGETPSKEDLERGLDELSSTSTAVGEEVRAAGESRAGNPRARRYSGEHDGNQRRFRALERTVFLTREMADVLLHVQSTADALHADVREPLAEAVARVADLVDTPMDSSATGERVRDAERALASYLAAIDALDASATVRIASEATVALCLRRMIDESRAFI